MTIATPKSIDDISIQDLLFIGTNSVGYTHYSTNTTYYDLSDLCLYLMEYYHDDQVSLDLVCILYEQALDAETDDE